MITVKLGKYFPDIVHYKLGELPVVIFYHEAEKLSVLVVDDITNLFFERERRKLLELKLSATLFYF